MAHDNYEIRYQRLLADVRAARDKIGDTPCRSAGFTAVRLLEGVLERHPLIPAGPGASSTAFDDQFARDPAREGATS